MRKPSSEIYVVAGTRCGTGTSLPSEASQKAIWLEPAGAEVAMNDDEYNNDEAILANPFSLALLYGV